MNNHETGYTYTAEELRKMGETTLSKLYEYEITPRERNTRFFKDIADKPPLFGRRKYFEKYQNAEIVYPVVVQASIKLFTPGAIPKAAVIIILPTTKQRKKDFKLLTEIVNILIAMRDDEIEVPESLTELVEDLNNPRSYIDCKINGNDIGMQHLYGEEFLIKTIYVSQPNLPNAMMPNDEVLPCLEFKDGNNPYYELINGKWYVS